MKKREISHQKLLNLLKNNWLDHRFFDVESKEMSLHDFILLFLDNKMNFHNVSMEHIDFQKLESDLKKGLNVSSRITKL